MADAAVGAGKFARGTLKMSKRCLCTSALISLMTADEISAAVRSIPRTTAPNRGVIGVICIAMQADDSSDGEEENGAVQSPYFERWAQVFKMKVKKKPWLRSLYADTTLSCSRGCAIWAPRLSPVFC